MKTITRKQLKGYGLSSYLTIVITKTIRPIAKEKNFYQYSVNEVIMSIRQYIERPKIRAKTRKSLEIILEKLLTIIENITVFPFLKRTNSELSSLAKKTYKSLKNTESYYRQLKHLATGI